MQKILVISTLLIMTSCTIGGDKEKYEAPNISGEIPSIATEIEGYEYPAIPLDEFNQLNSGSGN